MLKKLLIFKVLYMTKCKHTKVNKKETLYFSTVWDTCSTLYIEYSELKIKLLEYHKILPYIKHNVLRIYQYPHPLPPPDMLVRLFDRSMFDSQ